MPGWQGTDRAGVFHSLSNFDYEIKISNQSESKQLNYKTLSDRHYNGNADTTAHILWVHTIPRLGSELHIVCKFPK